ncbi:MAG TPA: radical SAM family heme chaperone HemW [Frankiaceae bacterium]|jgi:oxygen-independent coproporphyrinogen-3 oxidase|nr:radical SAM family heme chaperone HemW [Frankiaceae bacterium]
MPSASPDGEPAPADGALPESALTGLGSGPFGLYIHVPYCAVRCGYCDFNTYLPSEVGSGGDPQSWLDAALAEIQLARKVLGPQCPPLDTIFFGGGTPTLMSPASLVALVNAAHGAFGLRAGAEVTTEANPESVTPEGLSQLRGGGINRISFGMQSAVPHVLAALDRRHTPGRVTEAVGWARDAGFEQVSVDLIYGAPGESDADWKTSVEAAIVLEPDHVSAYALVVEEGTRLARQVRSGEVEAPDDDVLAGRYEVADELLSAAGYRWYEVSNWSRPGAECRHNLGYWRDGSWWGTGPGAHSFVGDRESGVRWWNVRQPAAYNARLTSGQSPAAARELLGADDRRFERLMLEVRLRSGLADGDLDDATRTRAVELAREGLLSRMHGQFVLTRQGRLLADLVLRRLAT